MRILLLTHAFNGLAQRLYVELAALGHELSVELDISEAVTREAVDLFRPDLVVAPLMKRAIPQSVWNACPCLVVHPGIVGDRGPSSLDWAILNGESAWGVTVFQANAVMDGGDVWASRTFPMRAAAKGSLYRNEVTEAAAQAVLEAVGKLESRRFVAVPPDRFDAPVRGIARPLVKQDDRRIDWERDDTRTVLRKIRSADGHPGVVDRVLGLPCRLFNAHPESHIRGTVPGEVLARREGAILRASVDGAVWITHLKREDEEGSIKLPAVQVLGERAAGLPESGIGVLPWRDDSTWQDLWYDEADGVGRLGFEFLNGAMSTRDCRRLRDAFVAAAGRPTRVILLLGGRDFWSNGIHLNVIESAESPADESSRNIEAMDDLCRAILECDTHLTIAAMRGNAGAGGVFLALAADRVVARKGITLNPHYRNMGNLYGSEYWTYLLPRRVGWEQARAIMANRLPMGSAAAVRTGLIDDELAGSEPEFRRAVEARAAAMASAADFDRRLASKRDTRLADERAKPIAAYRDEELARMKLNFYGFDPSYHVARYHFVHKVPHAWTPLHLAAHRRDAWRRREVA